MEKLNLILILCVSILLNQSFSQTNTEIQNIKTDLNLIAKSESGGKAYCVSTYSDPYDDYISNVTFNTINNSSGPEGAPDSYGDYTTISTGLLVGNTYNLSVSFVSNGFTQHVWAWIDWNNNENFNDPGEAYDLGEGADATLSINITVPTMVWQWGTRMRIIEQYSTDPSPCGDPHPTIYGETEDYLIYSYSNSYCSASGGCDEYISLVEYGMFAFYSNCDGYRDYTYSYSVSVPLNFSTTFSISNGNPNASDQCGVWVDWNRDTDFNDADETIPVTGSPGTGPL